MKRLIAFCLCATLVLDCTACGYTEQADRYGFLHKVGQIGQEIRHVSDWSRLIRQEIIDRIRRGHLLSLSASTEILTLDPAKHKFLPTGEGTLEVSAQGIRLHGRIQGEPLDIRLSLVNIPSLPFSPGKHLEVQDGDMIYRCKLQQGRLAMKLIHMIQTFHEMAAKEKEPSI